MRLIVASGSTAKHTAKLLDVSSQVRLHRGLHLLQRSALFRRNRDGVENAIHLIRSDFAQPLATFGCGAEDADARNHNAQQRQRG